VRYVLEGSARRVDDQVRITAQLVDAAAWHHLWAERYNRDVKDVFGVRNEISQTIVIALNKILTAENGTL
jgi:adenylate cyclase